MPQLLGIVKPDSQAPLVSSLAKASFAASPSVRFQIFSRIAGARIESREAIFWIASWI